MALVVVANCGLCADKLVALNFNPLRNPSRSRQLCLNAQRLQSSHLSRRNGRNSIMAVLAEPPSKQVQGESSTNQVEKKPVVLKASDMGLKDTSLESTTEHRLWVGAGAAGVVGMLTKAVTASHSPEDAIAICLAAVAAYTLSDLGTGIYHWGVDNYGDANTPVFGSQIDAFQGHHKRPWTITKRQFANNIHAIARPVAFFLAPFLALPSIPSLDTFLGLFLGFVVMSQQFHAWSHMKKSQLPPLVVALQNNGVLVSRKMHGAHHRSPYDINYCIVSGMWNPLLDNIRFFPRLEAFIHSKYGVAPRSWSETQAEWLQEGSYFEDGTDINVEQQQQQQ